MITFKELCENMNLESWHQNSHKLTKDSYGKPKMFYHGTKNDFDVFDVNRQKGGNFGKGFYFTDNIDAVNKNWASEEGSNVMPVYLKVIKPFDAKVINQEVIDKFLRENGDEDKIRDLSTNKNPAMYYKSLMSRVGHKFIDFLKKEGYDGVFGYSPAAGNQVVVFAPNQIKSKFAKSYSDSDKVTEIAIKGKAVKGNQLQLQGTPGKILEDLCNALKNEGFKAYVYSDRELEINGVEYIVELKIDKLYFNTDKNFSLRKTLVELGFKDSSYSRFNLEIDVIVKY